VNRGNQWGRALLPFCVTSVTVQGDEATPDWDILRSFYCFNFLTQRRDRFVGALVRAERIIP